MGLREKMMVAAAALGAAKMAEAAKYENKNKVEKPIARKVKQRGTTFVSRKKDATRKEEMERRAFLREGAAISLPNVTKEVMEGKTVVLKTGKYVPAGRFKNLQPHNR